MKEQPVYDPEVERVLPKENEKLVKAAAEDIRRKAQKMMRHCTAVLETLQTLSASMEQGLEEMKEVTTDSTRVLQAMGLPFASAPTAYHKQNGNGQAPCKKKSAGATSPF